MGRGIAPEHFFGKVESGLPQENAQNNRFGAHSGRKNAARFVKCASAPLLRPCGGFAAAFEARFLTPS
jgi:hypothetical protein